MAIAATAPAGTVAIPPPKPEPAPAPEPKPADPPAEGTTVDVDIKPEEVKAFASLSKRLREESAARAAAEEKLKALEGGGDHKTQAEKLAQAETMVKEGKHLQAARLLGIDLEEATKAYLAEDAPGEVKDPRLDALLSEREAEKKAQAEAAEKKAKEDEASASAAMAAAKEGALGHVKALAEADKGEKWPRIAKDAAVHEDVIKVAEAAVRKLGRAVSDEEATSIFTDAMTQVEIELRVRELVEDELKAGSQPTSREVKPRRVLETREIDTGERRPTATIDAQRGSTRSAPPEMKHMSAREARDLMKKELRERRTH